MHDVLPHWPTVLVRRDPVEVIYRSTTDGTWQWALKHEQHRPVGDLPVLRNESDANENRELAWWMDHATASLVFYTWHIPIYLTILLTSITIDCVAGIVIENAPSRSTRRRALLVVSMIANLGLLAIFKYGDFALGQIALFYPGAEVAPTLRAADGHFLLHLRVDELHDRRVPRGTEGSAQLPAVHAVRLLLSPSGRGSIVRATAFIYQLPRRRRVSWRVRTYINLALVLLLGGLWHGAAWTFVIWGAIHGAALAVERLLGLGETRVPARSLGAARADAPRWRKAVGVLWFVVVQIVVLVAWVFFRSADFRSAIAFLRPIWLGQFRAIDLSDYPETLFAVLLLVPVIVLHLRVWLGERGHLPRVGYHEKAFAAGVMLYGILTMHGRVNSFIYFQF